MTSIDHHVCKNKFHFNIIPRKQSKTHSIKLSANHNLLDVTSFLETERLILTVKIPINFFESNLTNGLTRVFVIEKKTGLYVGKIDWMKKGTYLPLIFIKKRKGFAAEAKYALIEYSFLVKGSKEINAYIDKDNFPSIRLHEKLGFQFSHESDNAFLSYREFLKVKENIRTEYSNSLTLFSIPRTQM